MAIYHPQTRIVDSGEAAVAPGASITAEGAALVRNANPTLGVQLSAGAAGEIFVGFSTAGTSGAPFNEPYAVKVQELVVPAGGTVTLDRTPVASSTNVFDVTANANVPISGGVTVTGNTVTGLTVGNTVRVQYKYALTIFEARSLYGNAAPGGYSGDAVGQVGVLKRGTLYTDQIVSTVDFTTAKVLWLEAGGLLSGGASVPVDGGTPPAPTKTAITGYVVAAPSVDYPFLAIEFSAA